MIAWSVENEVEESPRNAPRDPETRPRAQYQTETSVHSLLRYTLAVINNPDTTVKARRRWPRAPPLELVGIQVGVLAPLRVGVATRPFDSLPGSTNQ